eukprot:g1225.t1
MRRVMQRTAAASSSTSSSCRLLWRRCLGGGVGGGDSADVLCEKSSDGLFATITINRPQVHNALSPSVIEGLHEHFDALQKDCGGPKGLRAVFVRAAGKTFCAGGDLKHMRETGNFDFEQNKAEAMQLSGVFARIRDFPRPVVGLVNGPAYGGGVGVISCFDVAFCTKSAIFALSEVTLGVIPATISPFVIAKIGENAASRYFLTAERFGSDEAVAIGLINDIVEDSEGLDEKETALRKAFGRCSPEALASTKTLIRGVANRPIDTELREYTAARLAEVRESHDGKEGMTAFLEKRKPEWLV